MRFEHTSRSTSPFDEVKLGDVIMLQRGFDITKAEQTFGRVPIVSSSGVSSFHGKWRVRAPGVIIGRKGTLGTVHYVAENFWPHDTTLWVKDFKGNNPRFVSYFLKTLRLETFDTGSSNPTLNRNHVHKIRVQCPNGAQQEKIAAVLSAYDDLIENNRRRIGLLERMAEQLYREWFVRFRFPGYRTTTFRKRVPVAWDACRIGDVMRFDKGKNPAALFNERREGSVLYVVVESIEGGAPCFTTPDFRSVLVDAPEVLMLMDGARSGMVARGMTGVVGSTLAVLRTKPLLQNVLFEYMKAANEAIVFNNTGSAIPHANKNFISRMIIRLPRNESLIAEFNSSYDVIRTQADVLRRANLNLAAARDLLLPRLISGKLRVDDLDIQFPPSMQDAAA